MGYRKNGEHSGRYTRPDPCFDVWFDLTRPLTTGMPVYPGDPEFVLRTNCSADGIQVSEVTLSCHAGTHLDAPRHFIPGAATVDQIPLDRLIGPAWVVDLRGKAQPYVLDPDLWNGAKPGDAFLFCTGWTAPAPWRAEDFPQFTGGRAARDCEGAGEALLAASPWLIGIDAPTFALPDDLAGSALHRQWLGSGVLLLENLTGLEPLVGCWIELFVMPLPVVGADGAPARVIARRL